MHGQWLGNTEVQGKKVRLVVNVDADLPQEFMIHVIGEQKAIGLLTSGTWNGDLIALKSVAIYRRIDNGDVIAPLEKDLTEDERAIRDNISISLQRIGKRLSAGSWSGSDGQSTEIEFPVLEQSAVEPYVCSTWDDFKSWAARLRTEQDVILYRGHGSQRFRLQTTLHRAGRFRLDRYWNDVVPEFRDRAEAAMSVKFDKSSGDDQGVVLGLAQHHGLPTPLLDVSVSPYIAAFFAFSDAIENQRDAREHSHVRIYAFSRKFIDALAAPEISLKRGDLFVNSLGVSSRFNPRLIAQQGKFLVTNVDALESLVRFLERQMNETVMFAADIPVSCAGSALEDLSFMGLTAANMFPGLDGIGRMMRHQMLFSRKAAVTDSGDIHMSSAQSTHLRGSEN